jgi:hypothetical protein
MGRHPRSPGVTRGNAPPRAHPQREGTALSRFLRDACPRKPLRELHNPALYRTFVAVARSGSAIVSQNIRHRELAGV